ncbi:hypothetical protein U3516DRAFT_668874 [Neocallimastix sp. 'constans']
MQLDKNKYNNNSSIQNKPTISQNRTNSINSSQNFNKMSIDLLNKSNINKNNYNNMNINKNNMNKNNIVFNYLNTLTNFTTNKPMKINFKSNTNIESNCLIQPNNDYKNFMMNNNNDKSSNNGQTYLQYKLSSYQNRMNNNNTSNSNSNSIKSGSSSSSYSYNFNSNNIDHHVRKGSYNSTLMKEGFINESNKFCYGSSSTNNNSQTIIYNKNKMKNSNNNIFIDQDEYLTHAHMYRAKDNNFYPKLPNKTPSTREDNGNFDHKNSIYRMYHKSDSLLTNSFGINLTNNNSLNYSNSLYNNNSKRLIQIV